MTVQTEMLTLTKDDVTALRTADEVSFHVDSHNGTLIKAVRRPEMVRNAWSYTKTSERLFPVLQPVLDVRVRPIVVGADVHQFNPDVGQARLNVGYEVVYGAKRQRIWQTIAASLREGDRLHVVFGADRYSNGYTGPARLHADALTLQVHRKGAVLEYLVTVMVGQDNAARMCRRVYH